MPTIVPAQFQNRQRLALGLQTLAPPGLAPSSSKTIVDQLLAELQAAFANIHRGHSTLASGSVTVAATWVTANSRIAVMSTTPVGTQGILSVQNIIPGTSFQIVSSSGTDGSTVHWISIDE